MEHLPCARRLGTRPPPPAVLGADDAVRARHPLTLQLLVLPVGHDALPRLRYLLGRGHHTQGARRAALPAARLKGMVHHAQHPAAARGLSRGLQPRAALRGRVDPALGAVGRLDGTDGRHVPRDAGGRYALDLRKPSHPQGAAHGAPLLRHRPAHHPRTSQVPDVRPSRALHLPLRAARDAHPPLLHRPLRRVLRALRAVAPAHGAFHRRRYRLYLPRAALQRTLPADTAGGVGARRPAAAVDHDGGDRARPAQRCGPHRLAR
mmetsp:Transcript_61707/g.148640  ORF Transcript_61707/g.148640 Transcript_61707/m.148640 type:complete len:263 (+) Transcript_61707:727-1515(+)